jgi:hypothetical protein
MPVIQTQARISSVKVSLTRSRHYSHVQSYSTQFSLLTRAFRLRAANARVSNLPMVDALPPTAAANARVSNLPMAGLQLKASQSGSEIITAMLAPASTHKWQGRRVGQCEGRDD